MDFCSLNCSSSAFHELTEQNVQIVLIFCCLLGTQKVFKWLGGGAESGCCHIKRFYLGGVLGLLLSDGL